MKILFVVSLIFNVLLVTPNVLWMLRRLKFDTMMRQSIFDSGLKKEIDAGVKFDVSITDPPRKGCTNGSIENLVKLTNEYIVYVSCNVSTLARDMKLLNEKGFETVFVQPADLFPNTYHVETIAMFKKMVNWYTKYAN